MNAVEHLQLEAVHAILALEPERIEEQGGTRVSIAGRGDVVESGGAPPAKDEDVP